MHYYGQRILQPKSLNIVNDWNTYKVLEKNIDNEIFIKIVKLAKEYEDELTDKEIKYLITLSNMKGNFLILLVTANTVYTTFDVVYTTIMLYTQQILLSQSD